MAAGETAPAASREDPDGTQPATAGGGGHAAHGEPGAVEVAAALPPPFLDDPANVQGDPHLASVGGRQARQRELRQHLGPEGVHADPELLSSTARSVISRVYAKLDGTDFRSSLSTEAQVERLLQEATSHENLCQCYVGWCPFW
eukprot:gnl/TRDRNA2_/TRDRNA2_161213_c1_seq1.p1 gnl/TRDRNA2_/TRDRNA2_161213_c1~~gnl/TRDRNA2_/TRDRNA2_161213_c1_seq1.p1  ORF type:complete len:144 (+),score=19.38 gnl/TRDRNA2_/TRDRNA2_161213_c1_seq1:96-527(+)